MSKKSTKKTEVVVAEPEIHNNINMNLTHADVIDVAIQTQLEILEPQLDTLQKAFRDCTKQLEDLQAQVMAKAIERAGSSTVGKTFLNLIKMISKGLDMPEPEYQVTNKYFMGNQEKLTSREVDAIDSCTHIEEYKSPLAQFKRYSRRQKMEWNIADVISFNLNARFGEISLGTHNQQCKVQLTETELKNWKKMVQAILDTQADICQKLYDTQKEILELKYDEKKVKARVVKMSLSKTEQGRNILNLLQSATSVKLLE